jgi:hypothetical protein
MLDKKNGIIGLSVILEFEDGFRQVVLDSKDKRKVLLDTLFLISKPLNVLDSKIPLERVININMSRHQADTLKNWLYKVSNIGEIDRLFLIDNFDEIGTKLTVIINSERPYDWWMKNIPFEFIKKEL